MYRFRHTALFALVVLLLAPAPASAATEVAQKMQQAYAAITSMRADFTQTLTHKESGAVEKRGGVLYFTKPLLVRWENKSPAPELLVVGKDAIWNVFPDEELAYKYALAMAEDSRSLVRVVTGQARLDQDFDVEEQGREGDVLTARLYPKEPDQSLVEALLWVDAGTGLIKKLRVYDFYGNENEIEFSRQQPGGALDGALFRYTPPKDYLVEDRSKNAGAAPQKPLLQ